MGVITFAEFKAELDKNIGNRGIDDTRLGLWVNFGYLELLGAYEFSEIKAFDTVSTVADSAEVSTLPATLGVKSIKDVTTGRPLVYTDGFDELDETETGVPQMWTLMGGTIHLWPTPTDIRSLRVVHFASPTRFVNPGDVSVLPSTWDFAIDKFSTAIAFEKLGEEARAQEHLRRAVMYAQSRLDQSERESGRLVMPVRPIRNFSSIFDRIALS